MKLNDYRFRIKILDLESTAYDLFFDMIDKSSADCSVMYDLNTETGLFIMYIYCSDVNIYAYEQFVKIELADDCVLSLLSNEFFTIELY